MGGTRSPGDGQKKEPPAGLHRRGATPHHPTTHLQGSGAISIFPLNRHQTSPPGIDPFPRKRVRSKTTPAGENAGTGVVLRTREPAWPSEPGNRQNPKTTRTPKAAES